MYVYTFARQQVCTSVVCSLIPRPHLPNNRKSGRRGLGTRLGIGKAGGGAWEQGYRFSYRLGGGAWERGYVVCKLHP